MVALGYGKFARADRVYALVPLEGTERGDGRRTLVYVEGIDEPIIASRSEAAIAADLADALGQVRPGGRRDGAALTGKIQATKALTPFFAGGAIHVVDVKLYMVVRWLAKGTLDHVPATIFNDSPKLTRLYETFDKDARVKTWVAKHAK